jgi:hypothetical protein
MNTKDIEPDIGVPYTPQEPYMDLRERVNAMIATAESLGIESPEPTEADKDVAKKLVNAYAKDPQTTSKKATTQRMSALPTASLRLTHDILKEFHYKVAQDASQIRNLVTNKLILESENPDPKVRMKALELLGKISDVGLFSEKTEVTVTHQSSDDLKQQLRAKLEKLVNPAPIDAMPILETKDQEEIVIEDPQISISDIDVSEELS